MSNLYGTWEESFQSLYSFNAEIELRSPGSIVEIDTKDVDGEVYFNRFFMALKPCIDRFLSGCRPYISIDSTHLNGKWNGQLAVATALDGHNWMFRIAFGFFDAETTENWAWFMSQLKRAIGDLPVLAVCTDACKGLENAVQVVFPNAEKRECIKHLMANFLKKFRSKVYSRMWPAARAYEKEIFDHHMSKIFAAALRCGFNPAIKCDSITNNLAETFNDWIKDIKDLPIAQLVDKLREKIMVLLKKRRAMGARLQGKVEAREIQYHGIMQAQVNINIEILLHLRVLDQSQGVNLYVPISTNILRPLSTSSGPVTRSQSARIPSTPMWTDIPVQPSMSPGPVTRSQSALFGDGGSRLAFTTSPAKTPTNSTTRTAKKITPRKKRID